MLPIDGFISPLQESVLAISTLRKIRDTVKHAVNRELNGLLLLCGRRGFFRS